MTPVPGNGREPGVSHSAAAVGRSSKGGREMDPVWSCGRGDC